MTQDISKKFAMDHLKSDAELRAEVEQKIEPKKEVPKKDPRDEETYPFQFKYEDAKGRKFSGSFTNKILTIQEKMARASLEASFAGGFRDSLDDTQQIVNLAIAHMTFSLVKRDEQSPPKWADNLRSLTDENVILALFEEVSAHEGIFHGRVQPKAEGQGEAVNA